MMRENRLKARQKQRFKRISDSRHSLPIASNLLEQDVRAGFLGRASEPEMERGHLVRLDERRLDLARVLDLFARRVVGWTVSDRLYQKLALEAPRKALAIQSPGEGLTHHADRDSQYCSIESQAELRKHGIRISTSGQDNCYDNAVVERFFKSLKSEWVGRTVFQTRAEAKVAIGRYIDGFSHPVRHSPTLDGLTPVQFERLAE